MTVQPRRRFKVRQDLAGPRKQRLDREEKFVFGFIGFWAVVVLIWTVLIITAATLAVIYLANNV